MSTHEHPRIAIVEDDPVLVFMMDETCRAKGFDVVGSASNAADATALVLNEEPDFLILDFNLRGDKNGLELIADLRELQPSLRTILVTAWDINDIASRMDGIKPDRILRKPVMPNVLTEVIEHAWEVGDASHEPIIQKNVIGRSC